MKKKSIFIMIIIFIISGLAWFTNELVGNPVSKMIAKERAEEYIEANDGLIISKVFYNFKDSNYHVYVTSPTSIDTYFDLIITPLGELIYDNYESRVSNKWNTLQRLDNEYNEKVKMVFESDNFPYKSDIDFGELQEMLPDEVINSNDYFGPVYGIERELLEIDKDYDIDRLAKDVGHIIFYAQDEDLSIKRAAEILLDIKRILDQEDISFYAIDFVLEKPREEGVRHTEDREVRIEQFLYSDIYEEGLEERIEQAHEKLEAYYAKKDKEERNP